MPPRSPCNAGACDRAVPCGFDFGAQRCSERTAALSGSWEKLAEQRASEVGQLATSAPGLAPTSAPGLPHPRRRWDCRTHVGAGTDLRTSAQASALQESCAKLQKRIDRRAA